MGFQRFGNLVMPILGKLACFAVDFACWTNRKLESDSIVEIFADKHLRIDLLELDIAIACNCQLFGHDAHVRH